MSTNERFEFLLLVWEGHRRLEFHDFDDLLVVTHIFYRDCDSGIHVTPDVYPDVDRILACWIAELTLLVVPEVDTLLEDSMSEDSNRLVNGYTAELFLEEEV